MKYLIFAELSRNHFLFLTYFILSIIKEIVNHYIVSSNDAIHTFNKYYMCTLSDLLSIIPLTIIKMRSKDILKKTRESKKKETTELTSDINYIYTTFEQRNEKRAKRIIKLSILVSFLEFLALYINITYNIIISIHKIQIKKLILTCDISFNVISIIIFSYILSLFYHRNSKLFEIYFLLQYNNLAILVFLYYLKHIRLFFTLRIVIHTNLLLSINIISYLFQCDITKKDEIISHLNVLGFFI